MGKKTKVTSEKPMRKEQKKTTASDIKGGKKEIQDGGTQICPAKRQRAGKK